MAGSPRPPPRSPLSFPDGDIILRSADGVDLRLHTTLLSVASPFFRDMFSLPQTSNEVQMIEMTEKADVLVAILRVIYPLEEPVPYPSKLALDVYKAADKLQITRVQPLARRRLCAWLQDLQNPLEAWAIAVQLDIPEAITSEKRRFLSADTKACLEKYPDHLEIISAKTYAALIQTKEFAIQLGRRYLFEGFTCLGHRTTSDPWFPVIDCTYCIRFMHFYRVTTEGGQVFRPNAMDLETILHCHTFAKSRKCSHGYEARDASILARLLLKVEKKISTILSAIS